MTYIAIYPKRSAEEVAESWDVSIKWARYALAMGCTCDEGSCESWVHVDCDLTEGPPDELNPTTPTPEKTP